MKKINFKKCNLEIGVCHWLPVPDSQGKEPRVPYLTGTPGFENVGDPSMPPQNMPLGCIDYLELKTPQKWQMRDALSDLPLST